MSGTLVVIPCLNEEANLPGLLQMFAGDPAVDRLVVADGGSSDASRAIVAAFAEANPKVILLDNPKRLQSAGVNLAVARHGDGMERLVRVDAHCGYPQDYVRLLIEAGAARGADCVVVPMVSRGSHCFQIASAAAQNSRLGTGGSAHRHLGEGRFVEHGHHALMPIALFRAVGGYREDMSHNEDAELDHRLGQAGARIWLEPGAALVYQPRGTMRSLWRQYWNYGRGRARTLKLHRMRPRLRQMLPLAVPLAAVLALAAPLHVVALLPLLAWIMICLGYGAALGVQQRSLCAALTGPAAMIMHLAWGLGFIAETAGGKKAG